MPPQREDWWKDCYSAVDKALSGLPIELQYMITEHLDTPKMMEEGRKYHLEYVEDKECMRTESSFLF